MASNVLIVDDDDSVLKSLCRELRKEPYHIAVACSSEEALEILRSSSFKAVVADQRMEGLQGTDFLALVRQLYPRTVRILLTGHASLETAIRGVNDGEIYRFLTKPWDDRMLRCTLRSAIVRFDEDAAVRHLEPSPRQQDREEMRLEKEYPGICRVERDARGCLQLDPVSEEERAALGSKLLTGTPTDCSR